MLTQSNLNDFAAFELFKVSIGGKNNINLSGQPEEVVSPKFIKKGNKNVSFELKSQREQIARDLHDGIGSQLTHIISKLDIMAFNHKELEEPLSALREFTSETFQQLRETIWVLNQPEISYGQLTERIRGLLTRISDDLESQKIKIVAYGDGSLLLSPRLASSIFRIVQESVNNAMKYADSTAISVCLATDQKSLTVLVSDNGKGFLTEELCLGYGLLNIKRRAEELNGFLDLNSSISGTNVLVEFPLE